MQSRSIHAGLWSLGQFLRLPQWLLHDRTPQVYDPSRSTRIHHRVEAQRRACERHMSSPLGRRF
jgi:hypothetical protein